MCDYRTARLLAKAVSTLAMLGAASAVMSLEIEFGYDCEDCPTAWSAVDTGDRVNNCAGPDQSPIAFSFAPRMTLPIQIAWTR